MRSSRILTVFFCLLAAVALYFISVLYHFFRIPMVKQGVELSVKVYPNQTIPIVTQSLVQQGLMPHPALFEWVGNMMDGRLCFGEYAITYPLTAWQLLQNMHAGTGLMKHRLTIVEGWTFAQIRAAMDKNPDLTHTIDTLSNEQIMQKLGAAEHNPEGMFFPNTYFFTWGNTDLSVLKTAFEAMHTKLYPLWQKRSLSLPQKTPYQALIVASMIEKETADVAEKPLVASVIDNRLATGMRLQIDAAVRYGLQKEVSIPLSAKELAVKTPYNTYQIVGLPPTPICMPSLTSIEAALHPAATDYLYYVANGKGGHTFSVTYADHEKAVQVYRKEQE